MQIELKHDEPKLIAFHLPQFHPIPENDLWWGKGFTEWTNVGKATPLFEDHYQPHVPADLGYYDLRLSEAREAQAELAKEYGIAGFCFYHYWFNGKLMLERPVRAMLESGKPDFPFCLCWANEPWTRTWDGKPGEALMQQTYGDEDDLEHIRYLCKIFADRRYIRVAGKPLFVVYRASHLPDPVRTTQIWRAEARRCGVGEIYLCRVESFDTERSDPEDCGFDAAIEFQPDWSNLGEKLSHPRYHGHKVFDYRNIVKLALKKEEPSYTRYRCVTPSWDNTPRRPNNATVFINTSPDLYEAWLCAMMKRARAAQRELVFVNAWNEWGEGNHLEPDQKYGRAYLEATRSAVAKAAMASDTDREDVMETDGILATLLSGPQDIHLQASKQPEISVVMPAYNHERYIAEAIQSVLNQSFRNFELIVINDGSTDGTEAVVKSFRDQRIRYFSQENQDASNTINRGLSLSYGKYISIINSDDVYHPDRLASLYNLMETNDCVLVVTGMETINDRSEVIEDKWYERLLDIYRNKKSFELTLLEGNIARTTSNFFFRSSIIAEMGNFKQLRYTHDYDFILRAIRRYGVKIVFLHEQNYLKYRIHGNNTIAETPARIRKECHSIFLDRLADFAESPNPKDTLSLAGSRLRSFNEEIYSHYEDSLKEKDNLIASNKELLQQMKVSIQKKDEQIIELHNSLSWRVTAPLRWCYDKLVK